MNDETKEMLMSGVSFLFMGSGMGCFIILIEVKDLLIWQQMLIFILGITLLGLFLLFVEKVLKLAYQEDKRGRNG